MENQPQPLPQPKNPYVGHWLFFGIIVIIGLVGASWYYFNSQHCGGKFTKCTTNPTITNFTQCAQIGYPVTETYPRQCSAYGKTFTEGLPGSTNQQVVCDAITDIQACHNRPDCIANDLNCPCSFNQKAEKCGSSKRNLCEACLEKPKIVCEKLDCSIFNVNANTNSVLNINATANSNTNTSVQACVQSYCEKFRFGTCPSGCEERCKTTTYNGNTSTVDCGDGKGNDCSCPIVIKNTNTAVQEDYTLTLKSRTFTPPADIQPFFDAMKAVDAKSLPAGTFHGVVQLIHYVNDDERARLLGIGVTLYSTLHGNAYLASVRSTTTPAQVSALGLVRAMFPLERNDKLSKYIPDASKSNAIDATVQYFSDVPFDAAKQLAEARGLTVTSVSDYFSTLQVSATPSTLRVFADLDWVSWIEPYYLPTVN